MVHDYRTRVLKSARSVLRALPAPLKDVMRTVARRIVPAGTWVSSGGEADDGFVTMTPDTPIEISACVRELAAQGPAGDYCEFGMYRGYCFWHMQREAKALGLTGMRFFGFDSFAGLPKPEGVDASSDEFKEGDYACDRATVERYLSRYGVDWQKTHLIEGFFDRSLQPELRPALGIKPIAMALIDCDLYESTVPVLAFLLPLLQDGTRLLFDDWNCYDADDNRGERLAVREFLAANPNLSFEPLRPFGWHGQSFVVRKRGA